ncbi:class I SAM-dependent methyltransferase [Ruegeria sediminis]|uniref:Class I SAM-dependent methyltransferase n=1 Tax=Ruegeria sediminis TaxID=2583820 RepID=A0ABY2X349_9RHOB|nr:cyclopropane-fatty-acyl-phospholipid synthase family protein [Ruegeria sediminis]TMV09800.1 class I SAM-dependent methyltransferase [Ruegeria sediminis]
MWQKTLDRVLRSLISNGALRVTYPDGTVRVYGNGTEPAPEIRIKDKALLARLCRNPELAFGEGYMDGAITTGDSTLEGVMRVTIRNVAQGNFPAVYYWKDRVHYLLRPILQRNTLRLARRNVAHHYDLSDDFYRLMLDEDMQYSCAYFATPDLTLDQAQAAKKAHIARKLYLKPGLRVLDIGCGWGGLALTLARDHGVKVTGLTLSQNQHDAATERAARAGLQDRVEIRLQDYRELEGEFDRVVSVGMLEHVGAPHYGEFFGKVASLLKPDGVALIHTIGRNGPPTNQSPWLKKYIFPGGYVPSLSELVEPIAHTGLWHLDIESLRLHYAMTLRCWLERFDENLDQIREMYDDRFIRMWRFYLTICMLVFEERDQTVFQLQLGHRRDAVPLTRNYLYAADGQMRDAAE